MQKIFLIVGTFYGFVLQGMDCYTLRAKVNKLIIQDFKNNNNKKLICPQQLAHLDGITYDYEIFWVTHHIKNNRLQIEIALKNEAIKEKEVNQSIAIDKSDKCFIDKLLKQEDNYIQDYVKTLEKVFTKKDLDEHYNDYEAHQKAGMVFFNQQLSNILKEKEEERRNKEKK